MTPDFVDFTIGNYLRQRLMPVEGAIPHLAGIEMYGRSVPAAGAGGDLFEYINFQQRYDLDSRILRALQLSKDCLQAHPTPGAGSCTSVDDSVEWLKARPDFRPDMEAAHRQTKSLEQVRVAENLHDLYDTAGVLLVDAQGHGLISAKIASTVHDTFHALKARGFRVLLHSRVPCNDGGISLGQAVVAGARDRAHGALATRAEAP